MASKVAVDEIIIEVSKLFGIKELKEEQKKGTQAIVNGSDVFISQPTGYGKSLIFQMVPFVTSQLSSGQRLSALSECRNHFALVISPLNSLMRDQIQQLKAKNVQVLSLTDSGITSKKIRDGGYTFLFASPEALLDKFRDDFKAAEVQKRISCVVIDESHCIVKWYGKIRFFNKATVSYALKFGHNINNSQSLLKNLSIPYYNTMTFIDSLIRILVLIAVSL